MRAVRQRRLLACALMLLLLAAAAAAPAGLEVAARAPGGDMPAAAARGTANQQPGCTCHGGGIASDAVFYRIDGIPESYKPGDDYDLGVTIIGGTSRTSDPEKPQGGFALVVSAGELSVPPGMEDLVQVFDFENGMKNAATHTAQGNLQTSWNVSWKAPGPGKGSVSFYIGVNSVNGNGQADGGDQWQRVVLGSYGKSEAAEVPISALGVKLRAYWLGVIGIFSVLLLMWLSYYVIRASSGHHRGFIVKREKIKPPVASFGDNLVIAFALAGVGLFGAMTIGQIWVNKVTTNDGMSVWVWIYLLNYIWISYAAVVLLRKSRRYGRAGL